MVALQGAVAPRVDYGPGAAVDPDYYQSPYTSGKLANTSARLSWQRFAEIFFDSTLSLVYTGLDPNARYTLDIAYTGTFPGYRGGQQSMGGGNRLMANEEMLQDYTVRRPCAAVVIYLI